MQMLNHFRSGNCTNNLCTQCSKSNSLLCVIINDKSSPLLLVVLNVTGCRLKIAHFHFEQNDLSKIFQMKEFEV